MSRHPGKQLVRRAAHSLYLPGGVWQVWWSVRKIGRADFRGALRMGLPCCSKQRTGDGAPQLGAGDPFCMRERHSLANKEPKMMVVNPVEDGLCPGGSSAILLKDNPHHPLVQRVEVVSICPAFGLFSSEKFLGNTELWVTVWILTSSHSSEP